MLLHLYRRATAWFLTVLYCCSVTAHGQSGASEVAKISVQARGLQAKMVQVRVDIADGTRFEGLIVQVTDDAFVLRQQPGQDRTIPFSTVRALKKKGIRKKVWVPLVVGGAVVVALCAAPYPIGFLCRQDPS